MATSRDVDAAAWARTAGALLVGAADPWAASDVLKAYLLREDASTTKALEAAGIMPELVDDFRPLLPADATDAAEACRLGAAWEAGRRTQPVPGGWSPVATWIGSVDGIHHRTAETLISLLIQARRHVRLFAPFVDEPGLNALATAVSSATSRGVLLDFAARSQTLPLIDEVLLPSILERGNSELLRLRVLPKSEVFPHLKVLSVDQKRAYIGSANLTWPALIHNVEMGVLVDGDQVAILDDLFDQMLVETAVGESL